MLATTCTSLGFFSAAAQTDGDLPDQLVAVVHAHTTASSGALSAAQLGELARQSGVELVVLSENYGYRFRYAPLPIRLFFEAIRRTPSIEDRPIEDFLATVDALRGREGMPLFLVGVEVAPYYYWTGSLLSGDLTLHDMQRNVLVVAPLQEQVAAEFLEGLPVVGSAYHRRFGAASVLLFLPGALLLLASVRGLRAALRSAGTRQQYKLDTAKGRYVRRRPRSSGKLRAVAYLLLGIAAGSLLFANYPFKVPLMSPYSTTLGYQAHEDLFEHVADRQGLTFWSMPEADDFHDLAVGPVAVALSTTHYDEAIVETTGYTGFGAVYADTITTTAIGGRWDRALTGYLRGERPAAPWAVGESAFHFTGQAGKQLDDILTILLVSERTLAAAYDSLAGGRSYSTYRKRELADLRIQEFALHQVDIQPQRSARSGETLVATSNSELELHIRIADAQGRAVPIDVDVIRNGDLYKSVSTTTPFETAWLQDNTELDDANYYRLVVRGPHPTIAVSNPIFGRRTAANDNGDR